MADGPGRGRAGTRVSSPAGPPAPGAVRAVRRHGRRQTVSRRSPTGWISSAILDAMSAHTEQLNAKVPPGTGDMARRAAADKGVPLGTYLAALVADDTSGARTRFLDVSLGVLSEHAALFDELEEGDRRTEDEQASA